MKMIQSGVIVVALLLTGLAFAEETKTPASKQFGAKFALDAEVTLAEVLKDPASFAGKTIRVRGNISSVCKKKGCWMVLGDPNAKDAFIRVRMKDYGFFLPLDCQGGTAAVEGVFSRKLLGEKMVKHYAEDAGKDPKKISGTREELSMMATGISIDG